MEKVDNLVNVPAFEKMDIPGVTFGGFFLSRHMESENKILLRGKTLPQAMIACADKGKGFHLLTSFQWASMAYAWQKANSLDDLLFNPHTETWQWVMGLFMEKDGHVDVLGSLDVSYAGSPYGRGTIKRSGKSLVLVLDGSGINWLKKWKPGAFKGMMAYVAEANGGQGEFFPILNNKKDSLTLQSTTDPGNGPATFCIVKHISIDITKGMSSGDHITALHGDQDLIPFAIPGKTNQTEDPAFGNDYFWFLKNTTVRAALRGGYFRDSAGAGVFCLYLSIAPSNSNNFIGFRASKAL